MQRSPFPAFDGSRDWFWNALLLVRIALREAVVEAQDEIRGWLVNWDRVDDDPEDRGWYLGTFERHLGDKASRIDGRGQFAMQEALNRRLDGRVWLSGEEMSSTLSIIPNELLVVSDPLDGTGPARHLGDSYSSVAIAYLKLPGPGFALLGAAVCSGGIVVTWTADRTVMRGVASHAAADDEVLQVANEHFPKVAAIVAAKAVDRRRHGKILTSEGLDVLYNTGGTPRTWGLLGLELGSILAPKAQAPWDAVYLLPLMDLEPAVIVALDSGGEGRAVGREEVLSWFTKFELDPSKVQCVPPHIAASSQEAADFGLEVLRQSRGLGE